MGLTYDLEYWFIRIALVYWDPIWSNKMGETVNKRYIVRENGREIVRGCLGEIDQLNISLCIFSIGHPPISSLPHLFKTVNLSLRTTVTVTNNVTDAQSGICHLWGFTLLPKHLQLFYSAVQCSAALCSAVYGGAVECSAVMWNAVKHRAEQWHAVKCSQIQCTALHYLVVT